MDQTPHYKDEIDWQDLIRKPEKLFGYSYFYVLVVLVGIGLLYIWNLNTIGKNASQSHSLTGFNSIDKGYSSSESAAHSTGGYYEGRFFFTRVG